MAQETGVSGALALSPRLGNGAGTASQTADDRRTLRTAAALDPAQSAEIAQARVFERLLRAERTELEELAHRIARTADRPAESEAAEPGDELAQVRVRLVEIRRLLRALQGRFPDSASDPGR